MHKTPLAADRAVAIIIVTYNRVANLRVTLEACLAQQGDFHVLVVNNASTDDTAKYLEQAAAGESRLSILQRTPVGLAVLPQACKKPTTKAMLGSGSWMMMLFPCQRLCRTYSPTAKMPIVFTPPKSAQTEASSHSKAK